MFFVVLVTGCSSGGGGGSSSSSSGTLYGDYIPPTPNGKYSQPGIFCNPAAVYSSDDETTITIKGGAFGNTKGTVSLASEGIKANENLSVVSWVNAAITVKIAPKALAVGVYSMVIALPGGEKFNTALFEIIADGNPLIKEVIFAENPAAGKILPALTFSGTNFWQGKTPPGEIKFYLQTSTGASIQLTKGTVSGTDLKSVYNTVKNSSITLSGTVAYLYAVSGDKVSNFISFPITANTSGDITGKVYAVFIGINDYDRPDAKLEYALNDSHAMRAALGYGIANNLWLDADIRPINNRDAKKTAILANLNDIANKIGPDDLFFMFYSGHGASLGANPNISPDPNITTSNETYIMPVDSTNNAATAISSAELRVILAKMPAGTKKVLIFDSCYSGGFVGKSAERPIGLTPKFLPLESSGQPIAEGLGFKNIGNSIPNVFFTTASSYNELSYEDGNIQHGVYTNFLLQGLGANGNVSGIAIPIGIQALFNYSGPLSTSATIVIRDHFPGCNEQHPQLYTTTPGANCIIKGNTR